MTDTSTDMSELLDRQVLIWSSDNYGFAFTYDPDHRGFACFAYLEDKQHTVQFLHLRRLVSEMHDSIRSLFGVLYYLAGLDASGLDTAGLARLFADIDQIVSHVPIRQVDSA